MTRIAHDLTGQRFGKLTVVERAGKYSNGCALWLCKCDCGKQRTVPSQALLLSRTRSCGCYRKARFVDTLKAARDRYNARKRKPSAPIDTGPDIAPLMDAARAAWGRRCTEEAWA